MKKQHTYGTFHSIRHYALIMLILCTTTPLLWSCIEDYIQESTPQYDSDAVGFVVSSGISHTITRSGNSNELLEPLLLTSPEMERPLYLHTYVADEERRATGTDITRSTPINDEITFYNINKGEGFGVEGRYLGEDEDTETGDYFIEPWATAEPYQPDQNSNKDIWNVSPQRFWPGDDQMLRFYAFAPMSAKNSLENISKANGIVEFDYTAPTSDSGYTDAEVQPDLMFAINECKKSISEGYKAPLNFRHALSAIKFAVRDVVDGEIVSVTIKGVAGTAHCLYDHTGDTDKFTWSNHGEKNCSYTQTFNYTVEGNLKADSLYTEDDDKVMNDEMPEKTFMLIPQDISEDATIEVVFLRKADNKEIKMTGKVNDNKVTKWEPGKEYIYTISTSSSNWIYVFDVIGSNQVINEENPKDGAFNDDPDSIVTNCTIVEGSYYKVRSYRYRANNHDDLEFVPWQIQGDVKGTINTDNINIDSKYIDKIEGNVLINNDWIIKGININTPYEGSKDYITHDITFAAQMVATNWDGDWDMRGRDELGVATNPIDLSMVTNVRNTANCYVVNAGGYYKFPTVYGNAITNGTTLTSSYISQADSVKTTNAKYPGLPTLTDYKGNNITQAEITNANSAELLWQDAYNLISDVKLNNGSDYDFVSFKVNKNNIQQGNAVIAIKDASGTIIWSWHIWITEYWTNVGDLNLGVGDITCEPYDSGYQSFTVSPRPLGWCDAKNVWYVQRDGVMNFTQDISGNTDSLVVKQRERKIEYWIGNNTYYQFGRKDPFVGFLNTSSQVKYNFGDTPYVVPANGEFKTKSIAESIQNPNVLFIGGDNGVGNNWLSYAEAYHNLWNNTTKKPSTAPSSTSIVPYHYSGVKTVYDPCPAGYQVPPIGFFRCFTTQTLDGNELTLSEINNNSTYFNGYAVYDGDAVVNKTKNVKLYKWYAYSKKNHGEGSEIVTFTYTGHRWYSYTHIEELGAGYNYNPQIVYMWSNQIQFHNNDQCGYGLALGCDEYKTETGVENFAISFRFPGRRSMARPVRPVAIFTEVK